MNEFTKDTSKKKNPKDMSLGEIVERLVRVSIYTYDKLIRAKDNVRFPREVDENN